VGRQDVGGGRGARQLRRRGMVEPSWFLKKDLQYVEGSIEKRLGKKENGRSQKVKLTKREKLKNGEMINFEKD